MYLLSRFRRTTRLTDLQKQTLAVQKQHIIGYNELEKSSAMSTLGFDWVGNCKI